jgi:hypothetical protein
MNDKLKRFCNSPPRHLKIQDLEQAAVLFASGYDVSECQWQGDRLCYLFPDSEKARAVLAQLAVGDLKMDPRVAFVGFRKARRLLWERKTVTGRMGK